LLQPRICLKTFANNVPLQQFESTFVKSIVNFPRMSRSSCDRSLQFSLSDNILKTLSNKKRRSHWCSGGKDDEKVQLT
jgi:hypothetical protein